MSYLFKTPVLCLGLVVGLAAPAFCQNDSSARRIHFDDVNVRSNDNGGRHTITVKAVDDNGNSYRMRKVEGKIVELEMNGKPVSQDQFDRYADLLDGLATPPVPPVPPIAPAAPAAPAMPAAPVALTAPVAPAAPVAPGAPAMPAAAPVALLPPASPLPPNPPAPPEPPRGNKYISRIIDELIDKGIIPDDNKLSFSLDNAQLTVNQVRQSDSVFQVFKQKFIKHPGDHMSYEHSGSSTISSIKIDDDNH
jgi:hypothetical protein